MDWIQAITIIASILIPAIAGFAWIIHRMDQKFDRVDQKFDKMNDELKEIDKRLAAVENRLSIVETILAMFGAPLKFPPKERTDP